MRKMLNIAVVFFALLIMLPTPTYSQDPCSSTNSPQLRVGGYAQIVNPAPVVIRTGSPYEAGGLTIAEEGWQPAVDDLILVVEGPVCYEDRYVWRVQPPLHPKVPYDDLQVFSNAIWLDEASDGDYLLVPADPPPNNTPEIIIGQANAPIVNAALQINFTTGGGNPPPPCLDYLSNAQTAVGYGNQGEFQACLPLGFPVTSASTIRVFHAGRLYLEMQGEDGMEYWMIPVRREFPMGIWQVEFSDHETTHIIAYQLRVGAGQSIRSTCQDFYPIIYLGGFEPNQAVEFMQVLATEYHPTRKEGIVLKAEQIEQTFVEAMGEEGNLIAYYGEILDQRRVFIINESIESPEYGGYGGLFDEYPVTCTVPVSLEEAKAMPVMLGKLISGSLGGNNPDPIYYAFGGEAGQAITITVVALDNTFDPIIQLYDPSETLLAENDDAQPAIFGELNSQIADFVLPQDGLYSVSISRVSAESGTYVLLIQ
jgi:hypothetical protein